MQAMQCMDTDFYIFQLLSHLKGSNLLNIPNDPSPQRAFYIRCFEPRKIRIIKGRIHIHSPTDIQIDLIQPPVTCFEEEFIYQPDDWEEREEYIRIDEIPRIKG